MQGKIALITGAKGGLGTDVTQAFLKAGATVAGTSRSIQQSDFASPNFFAFPADITQSVQTAQLVNTVVERFKGIDVLVHVAGAFAFAKVHETDDETWNKMRDLNLTSGFNIAREVVRTMRQSGGGRIIAIGSLAAEEPHVGMGAYVASKMALTALFRTIALENGSAGITSNVILPGTMDTPANRKAMPAADPTKWVKPADVAKIALLLASDAAAQVNGALIPVYGQDV